MRQLQIFVCSAVIAGLACHGAHRSSPAPGSTSRPTLQPAPSKPHSPMVQPAVDPDPQEPLPLHSRLLEAAAELKAFAFVRTDSSTGSKALILSGMIEDGTGATCHHKDGVVRCIDLAGFGHDHLVRLFAHERRASITPPAWSTRILDVLASDTDGTVTSVEVSFEPIGALVMIGWVDGVRFAVRRDSRWRASDPISGGKSSEPFFHGSLDMTLATGRPSIGLVVGSYVKEACVRVETTELVVLAIEDRSLHRIGTAQVGQGVWVDDNPRSATRGLFDPTDPDHYLIRLEPSVAPDGAVKLMIASRHTPARLRKKRTTCGVELGLAHVDRFASLVGLHRLEALFAMNAVKE